LASVLLVGSAADELVLDVVVDASDDGVVDVLVSVVLVAVVVDASLVQTTPGFGTGSLRAKRLVLLPSPVLRLSGCGVQQASALASE
jgi:hypothetical protein